MQALPQDTSNEYWSIMESIWPILTQDGRQSMLIKLQVSQDNQSQRKEIAQFLQKIAIDHLDSGK